MPFRQPISAPTVPAVTTDWTLSVPRLLGGVAAGGLVGLAAAWAPILVFGGLIALAVMALLVGGAPRLRAPFLTSFAVLLAGYALLGRAFSYIGYPPIFLGEVFLVSGALIALGCAAWQRLLGSRVLWIMAIFAAWGATRTLPFVAEYGVDALRDGAVWGYAGFALIVAACLRHGDVERALRGYGRVLLVVPAAVICLYAVSQVFGDSAFALPWAPDVTLETFKLGDAGVHLGGAAAFVILGLGAPRRGALAVLWWTTWLIAAGLVASTSRGGFLAVAVALACAGLAGGVRTRATLLRLAVAAVLVGVIAITYPGRVRDDGLAVAEGREVSAGQILANVTSIFGSVGYGQTGGGFVNLDETKSWRLEWWRDIVNYTVAGEYFWQGRGFGINLADEDGYQVNSEVPLRSPHNVHMTILARSGVPGLLLWIALNATLVAALLQGRTRARVAGRERASHVHVWLLAYWAAIMVNASFDVYLEGPAGGVWFWALAGFAVAVLELQRRESQALPEGQAS